MGSLVGRCNMGNLQHVWTRKAMKFFMSISNFAVIFPKLSDYISKLYTQVIISTTWDIQAFAV